MANRDRYHLATLNSCQKPIYIYIYNALVEVREGKPFILSHWFSKMKILVCCNVFFSILLKINILLFLEILQKRQITVPLISYTIL